MAGTTNREEEGTTADRRRKQVLEAAAECFRRNGFHGSSMAQISAAAGMSSGHIYHYFKSKEEIITAIVNRERNEIEQIIVDAAATSTPAEAVSSMIEHIEDIVNLTKDVSNAALKMEILAEAARNPDIARVVQHNNAELAAVQLRPFRDEDPRKISRLELSATLMEGLSIRTLRNPNLDKELDLDLIRDVMRYILTG